MKHYYPSYINVLKPFLILIIFPFYFLIYSTINTFEFYLWLFIFFITLVALITQVFRLKNKRIKPILSSDNGFIRTEGSNLRLNTIDENLITEVIIKKTLIDFKLDDGYNIEVDVFALSNRDKKRLFKYLNSTHKCITQ